MKQTLTTWNVFLHLNRSLIKKILTERVRLTEDYPDGVIANSWFIFDAGTDREEIWHWFDEHHSKGVYSLMFPNAN